MDFSWRSFAFGFRLPLMFYLYLAWSLFKTCVWIWTFGLYCVMNYVSLCYSYLFMFILWLWGCANHAKVHIIYLVSCMPRFPLVGKTLSKFSNIYMCSWYSWKFICTYQGGVLSTHRTWWIYSYHILKFSRKWVSSSKVQFQVHLMPSV